MATLHFEDGCHAETQEEVVAMLAPLGVEVARRPLPDDPELRVLLDRPALNDSDKAQVLRALGRDQARPHLFEGWDDWDVIALHPKFEALEEHVARFFRCHFHRNDEVRYVLDGGGVFGLVLANGAQVEMAVAAGDYVRLPAGLEHWFRLDGRRRIKAVRIFGDGVGWDARFTGTPIRFR